MFLSYTETIKNSLELERRGLNNLDVLSLSIIRPLFTLIYVIPVMIVSVIYYQGNGKNTVYCERS